MIRVEKSTYASDANLTFVCYRLSPSTSGMCFNHDWHHLWYTVGEPIRFYSQHVVEHEDSS